MISDIKQQTRNITMDSDSYQRTPIIDYHYRTPKELEPSNTSTKSSSMFFLPDSTTAKKIKLETSKLNPHFTNLLNNCKGVKIGQVNYCLEILNWKEKKPDIFGLNQNNSTPGPGQYNFSPSYKKGGYSFGKDKRSDLVIMNDDY